MQPGRRHRRMDGTESTDGAAGEESGGTRGVNRRRALRAGAFTAAAFFIAHATGDFGPLRAAAESGALGRGEERDGAPRHRGPYNDDPIDPAAVADGSARWYPTRYGPADEIG